MHHIALYQEKIKTQLEILGVMTVFWSQMERKVECSKTHYKQQSLHG